MALGMWLESFLGEWDVEGNLLQEYTRMYDTTKTGLFPVLFLTRRKTGHYFKEESFGRDEPSEHVKHLKQFYCPSVEK